MLTKTQVDQLLADAQYTFAKTMPDNPHHYTVRKTWQNDPVFDEVVTFMRANGKVEPFKGRNYTVYYANGYKYWTMGDPLSSTWIINRKPEDQP